MIMDSDLLIVVLIITLIIVTTAITFDTII